MHWLWRATLAIGIASLWSIPFVPLSAVIPGAPSGNWVSPSHVLQQQLPTFSIVPVNALLWGLVEGVPVGITALAAFRLLSQKESRTKVISETRCRKCGYIIRGITEPRCPECGERI